MLNIQFPFQFSFPSPVSVSISCPFPFSVALCLKFINCFHVFLKPGHGLQCFLRSCSIDMCGHMAIVNRISTEFLWIVCYIGFLVQGSQKRI